MATFQASSTLAQSADGKTVTITDTSNYASNTSGVTLNNIGARTYTVTDGNGGAVATGNFTAGSLTKTFALSADGYLHTALSFILQSAAVATGQSNYLAENYYNTQLVKNAKKLSCDCNCGNLCDNTVKAMACKSAAEFYYMYGFAENAQELITDANTLINS